MSEFAATQISKPSDEQAFERCNEILWRCILKDDNVQIHGRRGQRQDGVDLFGIRDGKPDQIVGVQCKLKSDGKTLEEYEVRNEVEKALMFKPPLSEYYIVTTAPDDAKLNQLALILSDTPYGGREKKLIVRVWGWNTLEREIRRHPQAIQAFDLSHTPWSDQLEKKVVDTITDTLNRPILHINPCVSERSAQIEIEHLIDEYVDLIPSSPDTALDLFKKLQNSLESDAAGTIRFRIANNIAACQLKLGKEENAAHAFISAYDIDPKNPKAIANKALGLLLQDDWPALKKFAETQLSKFPDNAALAAYYIQGMRGDNTIEDPLVHVPETLRGKPEVSEAHVRWLVNRGDHGAWWDAAIAAHQNHPDHEPLKEIYADAVLDRLLGGVSLQYGRTFSVNERVEIEAAIDIYSHRWKQICNNAQNSLAGSKDVPLNLMLAYIMLYQYDKALVIGEEALVRFDGDPEIKQYMIETLINVGNYERANDFLSELEADNKLNLDGKTVMMRFKIYIANNDWLAVSELVSSHQEAFPEAERALALATKVWANVELASIDRRRTILEAEMENFQGNTRALIVLARAARIHQFDDLSSEFYKAGQEALEGGDSDFASRMSLAQEAAERNQNAIVADMLAGHLDLNQDSQGLRLLAEALVNESPIRARAVKFFEDLAPDIRCMTFFQKAEGVLHVNRGAPQEAVPLLAAVFEKERSVDNLMSLIHAHYNIDNRDAIEKLLQSNNLNMLPGSPIARLNLCHVLYDFGKNQDTLEMGYQALIDGLNNVEVVSKFLGCVIHVTQHGLIGIDNVVESGVWVRLTSKTGDVHEVLLDESADRPWGQKAETSNAFYTDALGMKKGEEFTRVNPATGISETWTVSEIKPRWLQAFDHMSMSFGQRFPSATGFASVPISKGDIEPVLGLVRRKSKESRNLANLYLVKNVPLAFLARNMSGGSIALANYIVSIGEDVRVCMGSEDEVNEALDLILANEKSGAVLDALTAWCAASLGIFSILEDQLGPLSIPANEFSCLQSMLDDYIGDNGEMMTLAYEGGTYIRQIITPEDSTAQRDLVKSRMEAIKEICAVEPIVIPDNLTDAGEQFMEPPFSDAVSPAVIAGQDRMLLCEDMAMRQLAKSVFGTRCVWIQVVLWNALREGNMTLDEYSDVLVQLASNRHGFVPVSAPVLLSVFMRDNSDGFVQIKALCNYLGNKNAEPASNIVVATEFINTIWFNYLTYENKVKTATQVVLKALLANDSEKQVQYVTGLATVLNQLPKDYFVKWCQENGVSTDKEK